MLIIIIIIFSTFYVNRYLVDNLQDVDEKSEQTNSLDETLENVKEVIEDTVLQSEQQMSPTSYKDQKQIIHPLLEQKLKKGDSW